MPTHCNTRLISLFLACKIFVVICKFFTCFCILQISFKKICDGVLKYDLTSFLNCICGGLFLGICLLELLPEARESVQTILTDLNVRTSLPITEFFVAIGLLLVMLVEQSVDACVRRRASKRKRYDSAGEMASANSVCSSSTCQNDADNQSLLNQEIEPCSVKYEGGESSFATEATRSVVLIALLSVHSIFEGLALGLEAALSNLIQLLIAISVHKSLIAFSLGLKLFETFSLNKVFVAVISTLIFCTASPLGCAIGILMTLGHDDSTGWNPGDVTTIGPNSTNQFTTASIKQVTGTDYATAIMECLATGTFLYVTFIEVIPLEFAHGNDDHVVDNTNHQAPRHGTRKKPIGSFLKLLALLLGFATVTGLQFI